MNSLEGHLQYSTTIYHVKYIIQNLFHSFSIWIINPNLCSHLYRVIHVHKVLVPIYINLCDQIKNTKYKNNLLCQVNRSWPRTITTLLTELVSVGFPSLKMPPISLMIYFFQLHGISVLILFYMLSKNVMPSIPGSLPLSSQDMIGILDKSTVFYFNY